MKKFIIVLISLLSLSAACYSQDFQVYSVKGDITVKDGKKVEKVTPGMILKASNIIIVPTDSRLVVLYEKDKQLFTIKNPITDNLGNIIKAKGITTQQLTESYLAFVKQKITDTGNPKDKNYKQSAGTAYRDTDTLLMKAIIPGLQPDTTKKASTDTTIKK